MVDLFWARYWPNLGESGYRKLSPISNEYNCFAWAAGRSDSWWEPTPAPGYYWPPGVPNEYTVDACIRLYESLGYVRCDDPSVEPLFDKVAVYGLENEMKHAALQLDDGSWTSKLGPWEDIVHNSLEGLEGLGYGKVVAILKRPRLA